LKYGQYAADYRLLVDARIRTASVPDSWTNTPQSQGSPTAIIEPSK